MTRHVELLAPGGELDAIKAAIVAGADAIYCGLDRLNARHRAANITLDELGGVLALAHSHGCRVYLTLNVMMVESDLPVLVGLLNRLVNTSLDGVIVQDLGLLHLLSTRFAGLEVHASTQLTTHNEGQIRFLRRLGAARVNLSRELSLDEIRPLVRVARAEAVSTEVFVHGSYCISFSGICYLSSVHGGNSGNRGRCSQPCRDRYATPPPGSDYPLNLKDNSAYLELQRLVDAGVDAMKIEGRMKPPHYVYTVTDAYRRRLRSLSGDDGAPADDGRALYNVFNRGFSAGYLRGEIGRQMFSDHSRNRSADHLRQSSGDDPAADPYAPYDVIDEIRADVAARIEHVSVARKPLTLRVSGRAGAHLRVAVHTPDTSFEVSSASRLVPRREDSTVPPLDAESLLARLKAINATEHTIDRLALDELQPGLFVPQGELVSIKKRILCALNGSREPVDPVEAPALDPRDAIPQDAPRDATGRPGRPGLAVLVAAAGDLDLCDGTSAEICFQLPNELRRRRPALVELFTDNRRLIPWFPAILIGEDYAAAVRFLHQVRPGRIVTNNSGVAHEAWRAGVPWIAGPYLNTANSLGLRALKERFDCRGAIVSHELGMYQLKRLAPPAGFELHYSLYHPTLLLTSRQCLFQQVSGCDKDVIDDACLGDCERSATITHPRLGTLHLNKTRASYCSVYHQASFLNTGVVTQLPALFSGFLVDLRAIETGTRVALDRSRLVRLFEDLLRGDAGAGRALERGIAPTTRARYEKGV